MGPPGHRDRQSHHHGYRPVASPTGSSTCSETEGCHSDRLPQQTCPPSQRGPYLSGTQQTGKQVWSRYVLTLGMAGLIERLIDYF